jgi:cytidyltransferase-like protein
MIKVFVSGCYDILHGGHIEFFETAKKLGDYLIVSIAGDKALWHYKNRKPSIPTEHKKRLISSLSVVNEVIISDDIEHPGMNFISDILKIKPDILAVTEDDQYEDVKKKFCEDNGIKYVKLPKDIHYLKAISTSSIVNFIKAPNKAPLRVDFAGGWLDVPKFAKSGGYIVNCAIQPMVSIQEWPYHLKSGLGGSAAYELLSGNNSLKKELDRGVGWQDPAIISETGLCSWHSGETPKLDVKVNPGWLIGKMALLYTNSEHNTADLVNADRPYSIIYQAGRIAREAIISKDLHLLQESIKYSYSAQLHEGMKPLPDIIDAVKKYCGSGWGGYALYLFENDKQRSTFLNKFSDAKPIEPYINTIF